MYKQDLWIGMYLISIFSAAWVGDLNVALPFKPSEPIPTGGADHYGIIEGSVSGTANVFDNGPYDLFVGLRTCLSLRVI